MIVSNSQIQTFKSCRRLYQRKYINNLEFIGLYPGQALEDGKNYHEALESVLISGDYWPTEAKIAGMIEGAKKYIVPYFAGDPVVASEVEFRYTTPRGHTVIGYYDGLTAGGCVVEHKTTSFDPQGVYREALENDEQTKTYLVASQRTELIYTICRKPTIRQRTSETADDFAKRVADWYDEDTEHRITVFPLSVAQAELDEFLEEQDAVIDEMEKCQVFYKNPGMCNKYGHMCEFFPVCNHYQEGNAYINFQKKDARKIKIDDFI